MDTRRLEFLSFVLLFSFVSLFIFLIFRPFLYIICLAAILAILFYPLYGKLVKILKGSKSMASLIMTLAILFFIIVPLLFLGTQIFHGIQGFYTMSQNDQLNFLTKVQSSIENITRHFFPNFTLDINVYITKILSFFSDNLSNLVSGMAYILLNVFLMLILLYFFLRDGEVIAHSIISLSPFSKNSNELITQTLKDTISAVMKGTLFVASIRLFIVVVIFFLAGIPNPILWGSLAGILGAIPGLGTPISLIPAIAYLFIRGDTASAIFLIIFGVMLVVLVDNMLTTYYFGRGLHVAPIFIVLSILGGVLFFGPLGFIFGPLILSLFIATLTIYKILILKKNK